MKVAAYNLTNLFDNNSNKSCLSLYSQKHEYKLYSAESRVQAYMFTQ